MGAANVTVPAQQHVPMAPAAAWIGSGIEHPFGVASWSLPMQSWRTPRLGHLAGLTGSRVCLHCMLSPLCLSLCSLTLWRCTYDCMQLLQSAKADERVRGLLTVLGDRGNFAGMAQLQELRNALLDFRVRFSLVASSRDSLPS